MVQYRVEKIFVEAYAFSILTYLQINNKANVVTSPKEPIPTPALVYLDSSFYLVVFFHLLSEASCDFAKCASVLLYAKIHCEAAHLRFFIMTLNMVVNVTLHA